MQKAKFSFESIQMTYMRSAQFFCNYHTMCIFVVGNSHMYGIANLLLAHTCITHGVLRHIFLFPPSVWWRITSKLVARFWDFKTKWEGGQLRCVETKNNDQYYDDWSATKWTQEVSFLQIISSHFIFYFFVLFVFVQKM